MLRVAAHALALGEEELTTRGLLLPEDVEQLALDVGEIDAARVLAGRRHDDRLLVHRRAEWKDVFPGAWDLAFGGICDVDEDWESSAYRELMEEAGVRGELTDRGPVSFEAPGVALVGRFFVCRHAGPFTFNDGEVTDSQWVPLKDLADFVNSHEVPPDSELVVTSLVHKPLTDEPQSGEHMSSSHSSTVMKPNRARTNRGTL